MNTIFSDDCLHNILGHIKNSWTYGYPSGATLENALYQGVKPFYPDARNLGSPSTIVDVGKETQAFDVKGRKVLGHVKKLTGAANHVENQFVDQAVPGAGRIKVKIPRRVMTQVRRPKVDLKGYKGDAQATLEEQIEDYAGFAFQTTNKDGYKDLYSVVLLYGIDKGFKSVFLSVERFAVPKAARYEVGTNAQGLPCSYNAYDDQGHMLYNLSSFNKGSSNFYKQFSTSQGVLMTWPEEEQDQFIYTRPFLEKTSAIKTV